MRAEAESRCHVRDSASMVPRAGRYERVRLRMLAKRTLDGPRCPRILNAGRPSRLDSSFSHTAASPSCAASRQLVQRLVAVERSVEARGGVIRLRHELTIDAGIHECAHRQIL